MRAVRVRYYRDGDGYRYEVLAADSLTWLGQGWGKGRKHNAVESFRAQALARGWEERDMRAERMKAVA